MREYCSHVLLTCLSSNEDYPPNLGLIIIIIIIIRIIIIIIIIIIIMLIYPLYENLNKIMT